MILFSDGSEATSSQIVCALSVEARSRGISYGQLTAEISEWEKNSIVSAWLEAQKMENSFSEEQCSSCMYWKQQSETVCSGHFACHFFLNTGKKRRRDENGNCLEVKSKK